MFNMGIYSSGLGAYDSGRHAGEGHNIDDAAKTLVVVLNGFSYAEYRLAFAGIVEVWAGQVKDVLNSLFRELSKLSLQRFGQGLFNLVLEVVLESICNKVPELASSSGHSAPGQISIVNPLRQGGQVTGGAQLLEACDDIHVGKGVAADVDLADDTDSWFALEAVDVHGVKVISESRHELD